MLQTNASIVRPRCTKCGAAMQRASVIPGFGRFSHRIFKCDRCGETEIIPEADPS